MAERRAVQDPDASNGVLLVSGRLQKEEGEGERVPAHSYKIWTIPIMLETDDELEVRVKDGKVDISN